MNIYLCTRNDRYGYDDYDSFVCIANNLEEARNMLPDNDKPTLEDWKRTYSGWCKSPDLVDVEHIGKACGDKKSGVVLSSFNAG